MTDQDQKAMYTAFIVLGLLVKGEPLLAIPDATKWLIQQMMEDEAV
jgi:hypothetical protein